MAKKEAKSRRSVFVGVRDDRIRKIIDEIDEISACFDRYMHDVKDTDCQLKGYDQFGANDVKRFEEVKGHLEEASAILQDIDKRWDRS
jgi:hypothetical protein